MVQCTWFVREQEIMKSNERTERWLRLSQTIILCKGNIGAFHHFLNISYISKILHRQDISNQHWLLGSKCHSVLSSPALARAAGHDERHCTIFNQRDWHVAQRISIWEMSKYSRPFQIILAGETRPQKTADAVIIALLGLWHDIKDKSVQPRGAVITTPAQFKPG